ncbi:MAG: hypothetical protein CFE29_18065 [Bradyrhizobiaceae bacterium PARB1]|nr:MAG: hypothetical protein CFE29_18065 [Bradyrhizobiaceae bacterium PARB1]
MQANPPRWQGVVFACLAVSLFASFILVSRAGLTTTMTIPDIAALRFGTSALILSPIILMHGLCGLRWHQAIGLAILGGFGFALSAYTGFLLAPAAHGGVFLHGTLPLTTALLFWALRRKIDGVAPVAALVTIGLGIVIMAWSGAHTISWTVALGDFSLLLASLFWSGYGIYVRALGLTAIHAAAIVTTISAALFVPIYLLMRDGAPLQASWNELMLQAAFQGVLIGAVSIFVYTRAVAILGAGTVALFTAAVPVLTTFGGLVLLAETPGIGSLIGVALVSFGCLMPLFWRRTS